MITSVFSFGTIEPSWQRALDRLTQTQAVERLWEQDWTLFGSEPTEISNRLGWLDAPIIAADQWESWADQVDEFLENATGDAGPITDALILGMGGSSLFPELLATTFEPSLEYPTLRILDSTNPVAIQTIANECNPATTVVIAASKSGSTVETMTQLEFFWHWNPSNRHFAVITDPGSALAELAAERDFGSIFLAQPNVGGRFSALTAFGLVPAALMGLSAEPFIDTALEFVESLGADVPPAENLAAQLAAFCAGGMEQGRDILAITIDEHVDTFGDWLEQLIAESTGKSKRGLLPFLTTREQLGALRHSNRVLHISIGEVADHTLARSTTGDSGTVEQIPTLQLSWEEPGDLGAHILLWELATAWLGMLIDVNPFDQPDVESAKQSARAALKESSEQTGAPHLADSTGETAHSIVDMVTDRDAVALTAFVHPEHYEAVEHIQQRLQHLTGVPVTLGFGPRYLHSTGQYHKGGPDSLVVIQVVEDTDEADRDVEIPGQPFSFGELFRAQADGDLVALQQAGKRVQRVSLNDPLWSSR